MGKLSINMYSTGGLASIGTISFSGSTSASLVDVIVGSGALNTDQDADLSDSAQNWGGVSFPFSARLSGAIAGNLTGAINPDSIVRLEVHGQVSASISCGAASGTAIRYLQLGSTSSSGVIDAGDGDIGTIEAESTGAAIAGSILALSGHIESITTYGDIYIPLTAPSPGIQAQDGIGEIYAASITANITANANSGTGSLLRCRAFEGDFVGSIQTQDLGNDLDDDPVFEIEGKVDGEIEVAGNLSNRMRVFGYNASGTLLPSLIVHGDFNADFQVYGDIGTVEVDGSMYATLTEATLIAQNGNIESLTVGGDIAGSDYGQVYIAADSLGELTVVGSASMSYSVYPLYTDPIVTGSFIVGGDLRGFISVSQEGVTEPVFDVIGGVLPWPTEYNTTELDFDSVLGVVRIGGSLSAPVNICGETGLVGLIAVNASNDSGELDGPVYVNACGTPDALTTLPYYTDFAVNVGGGAVGLVPYHLHDQNCNPQNNLGSVCEWPSDGDGQFIAAGFYGQPVDGTSDSNPPVRVYISDANWPPSWTEVTSECDIEVAPTGHRTQVVVRPSSGGSLGGDFGSDVYVKVVPKVTSSVRDLRCANTFAGTPPQTADFEYLVGSACLGFRQEGRRARLRL